MQTQPKQIQKYLQALIGITGFAAAGGTSDNVSTVIGTALNTAGDGGVSVPNQVGSRTTEGVNTASGMNFCPVYTAAGVRMQDGNGNDVYGKLTFSGSTYTLGYFSVASGSETAFTMAAATTLGFEFPYVFTFEHFPYFGATTTTERHIAPDAVAYAFRATEESLTVTAVNTLSALTKNYVAPFILIIVNGVTYTNAGSSPPFTVSGATIAWSAANAGFALATTDDVKVVYSY